MSEPINSVVSRKITGSSTGESPIILGNIDQDIPWEERKIQVVDLCKSLWPTAISHECDDDAFVGGYNEVYFVTITESDGTSTEFVIRCPQETWWFTPLIDSVAILHHIKQTTSIRVPSIIAFDTTPDNRLKSKYIVLERLKGKTLQSQIHQFTTEQRVAVAKELGELYTRFRSIKMPYAGRIVASPSGHITSLLPEETLSQLPIAIEPYGARCPEQVTARLPTSGEVDCFWTIEEEFLTSGGLTSDPPNLPLHEAVTRPFDRRIVQETTSPYYHKPEVKASAAKTITQFANLYIMIETIVEEGKVEDASGMDFYLWHSDLLPRNIMVDVDSTPMITGIIDWDEAVYAPKFATALAPWWLWELPPPEEEQEKKPEGEDDDPYTYHVDPMEDEETFEKVDSEPPELAAVKRAWEEAIGPEYAESAMSHYAILARRVLRFSLAWQWAYWWQDLYSQTLAEWKALRPVEESEEESDDDSDDSDDDSDDSEDASEDGSEDEENPEAEAGDIPEDDGDEIWESYSEDEDEDDA